MSRDPIELEIFKNIYHSIAEEMGAALRRTAFSPNIKERRDYSCAVFDSDGEVIAMGDHMPVHLGSMPRSVLAAINHCKEDGCELLPGDVVMLNDPFRGGTHLPDITLVAPVYVGMRGRISRHYFEDLLAGDPVAVGATVVFALFLLVVGFVWLKAVLDERREKSKRNKGRPGSRRAKGR